MKAKNRAIKMLLILGAFLLLTGLIIGYFNWRQKYRHHIYPGVKVGEINLSGKTHDEALEIIGNQVSIISGEGLKFESGNKQVSLESQVSSFDSDLAYPALIFDVNETVERAFQAVKRDNFINFLIFKLRPQKARMVTAAYSLDENRLKEALNQAFPELVILPANASFSLDSAGQLKIDPEKIGKEINYDLLLSELKANLNSLQSPLIAIKTHSKYPGVGADDLAVFTAEAKKIINQAGITLTFEDPKSKTSLIKTWVIKADKLLIWLSLDKTTNKPGLSLDQTKIKDYLLNNVSPQIDLEALRPRFEIKNGKVSSWQVGTNGRRLNPETTAALINEKFWAGETTITLLAEEVLSEPLSQEETLNIQEIIGTGHSNFAGSSSNRRKNIRVGADAVHGVLLAPGEEFSLVKVLGEVDEASGYVPELVIKGDKTIPEYGGGLCQIGTTVFRSALASGLPITERRNHSYRVSYYEPAGTDAAIYIPHPDVRFVNDTPSHILIQARIEKDDIYFDFWGKKDGRLATTTTPVVYNIVKPAPTKYIETDELLPGQKKCTEKAHNGADTYFDYKVIYPENATTTPVQERRFSSHYVPWQEVCLIGRATTTPEVASSTETETATTTE